MTTPHGNGGGTRHAGEPDDGSAPEAPGAGINSLIDEALRLRDVLHDAFARTGRLVAALKRHRQQAKLVAGALVSLRQLQRIAG